MRLRKILFATYSLTAAILLVQPVFAQQSAAPASVAIVANERDGAPASITFSTSTVYNASEAATVFSKYLALNPATDEMRLKTTDAASTDINVARYTQYYKGIKVAHGSYIIASKNGVMSYMSGNFYRPATAVNTTPRLTEAAALQKALDHSGAKKYMWEVPGADDRLKQELNDPNASYAPKGELVLIEDYFSGDVPDGILHLAYHFDIFAVQPLDRNDVYVDAVTGRILFTNAIIKHVQGTGNSMYSGRLNFEVINNNGVYSLHDSTRGTGINTYSLGGTTDSVNRIEITSTSDTFASNVAIDAHWGAQKVYDYWKLVRNRLSYNGSDAALNSYVDYGSNYNNAFWGGTAMFYGNGSGRNSNGGLDPLVSMDICAHEIGHGVCQTTAGLIYNRESGGMNEGFSDIWAAVIENYANPHETDATAKNRWKIGEEISNTPLRDMSNPITYGDPDTYGGANWKFASSSCSPNTNTNDNCGVHSNSGVLNKWFYFLTEGGSGINGVFNHYEVPGIGIDTAAQIAFGTELSLTQTANYAACRTASINYAIAQYGACSKVVEAVTRAWYAVNVGADYAVPATCAITQVSFGSPETVTENAASADCNGSRIINVPVKLNGIAPTGGNASVTITVTGGTAVNGVDYTIPNPVVTFPAGSTTPQSLAITVFDNGNTTDADRYIDLGFSLNANGSNIIPANVLGTTRITITNDDAAPVAGVTEVRTVGTYNVASNNTSPFQSSSFQARLQYIFTVQELIAAGVKPKATLTKAAFTVISKTSTRPYTNFTVQLGATQESIFTTGFTSTGMTQVYQSDLTTTNGLNTLTFTNGYVWDGTSNLVMEVCFTDTARGSTNDQVQGTSTSGNRAAYNYNNNSTGGCNLPFSAPNVASPRPVIRFTQVVAPTPVATTIGDERKWDVDSSDRTYFYSTAGDKIIAGIWNGANNLGCVTAAITQEGNGFVPTVLSPIGTVNRSLKEISITPSRNDTSTYTGFFYLTNDELDGSSVTNIQIVRTTAPTDADMDASNTQVIATPTTTSGLNYKSFRGTFTGFGRYFFIGGNALGIHQAASQHAGMYVVNNPFSEELKVAYNSQKNGTATIRLMDITGKVVYNTTQNLSSGKGQFAIPVSRLGLAAGQYVLQVVNANGVYTQQVLKN